MIGYVEQILLSSLPLPHVSSPQCCLVSRLYLSPLVLVALLGNPLPETDRCKITLPSGQSVHLSSSRNVVRTHDSCKISSQAAFRPRTELVQFKLTSMFQLLGTKPHSKPYSQDQEFFWHYRNAAINRSISLLSINDSQKSDAKTISNEA